MERTREIIIDFISIHFWARHTENLSLALAAICSEIHTDNTNYVGGIDSATLQVIESPRLGWQVFISL